MGNWIQLTSGGGYDFDTQSLFGRFDVERDLAYSLAGINRYLRHTAVSWSVAIHSVAVARTLWEITRDKAIAAAGLGHDWHECIVGDIPTPVAWAVDYQKIKAVKEEAQLALEERMGVPPQLRAANFPAYVKAADLAALHVEKQLFMVPPARDWGVPEAEVEYAQVMYDVVADIVTSGQHRDGGLAAFMGMYEELIAPFVVQNNGN